MFEKNTAAIWSKTAMLHQLTVQSDIILVQLHGALDVFTHHVNGLKQTDFISEILKLKDVFYLHGIDDILSHPIIKNML